MFRSHPALLISFDLNELHQEITDIGEIKLLHTHILPLSQSTVDCSTLDGLHRETIVRKGLEKPRGIAVHPLAK